MDVLGDEVFKALVLARLIEPTSKADTLRVLGEVGATVPSLRTVFRALTRAQQGTYRQQLATACFAHAAVHGDVTLVLYDRRTLPPTSAGTGKRSPTGRSWLPQRRAPGGTPTITPRTATKAAVSANDVKVRAEPVWDPAKHERSWRAVWAYSAKRAARDGKTLTVQENRAKAVIAGEKTPRTPRFVTIRDGTTSLDEASLARARRLVGLKGYVTNIPATLMPAGEVIGSYHELWHVEASFRMSKHDLRARPIFHHHKDAIEAHLTIVFAALAIARHLQHVTGVSTKKLVRTLRPLQEVTVRIAGHEHTANDPLTPAAQDILNAINAAAATH